MLLWFWTPPRKHHRRESPWQTPRDPRDQTFCVLGGVVCERVLFQKGRRRDFDSCIGRAPDDEWASRGQFFSINRTSAKNRTRRSRARATAQVFTAKHFTRLQRRPWHLNFLYVSYEIFMTFIFVDCLRLFGCDCMVGFENCFSGKWRIGFLVWIWEVVRGVNTSFRLSTNRVPRSVRVARRDTRGINHLRSGC